MKNLTNVLAERNYYKPFDYPQAYSFYEASEKMHWLAEEVPMHQDIVDWNTKLTDGEREHLTQVFRFFTQSDCDIAGAYANKYLPIFKLPEIRMMLLSYAARETVHIKAYSHLIDTLGMPDVTYKQFHEYEVMREKHSYFEEFLLSDDNSLQKLIKDIAMFSAFTEGMQLFSSFVMLLNFTRFNKMNGMGQIITWSIRDESLHCEGMTWLFRELVKENKELWTDELKSEIYTIASKMVELEDKFIELSYENYSSESLPKDSLKLYNRYITDRRLIGLGLKGIFKVKKNPLPWVEEVLNAPEHSNFFEQKATAYSKASFTGTWDSVWV